ncbi:MAG: hypothetical protein PVF36_08070 [Desulfobacterales bacterium]|jgi:hypothetical protein
MRDRVKVRLKIDLTEYLRGLIAGSEGYTIGKYVMWSRVNDNFIGVHFPEIGSIDVLWSSLEIIDEEHLNEVETLRAQRLEECKSAKDIVKYIGPRGGFKYLSFHYTDSDGKIVHYSNGFKHESEKIIEYFINMNYKITEKTTS